MKVKNCVLCELFRRGDTFRRGESQKTGGDEIPFSFLFFIFYFCASYSEGFQRV